LKLQAFKTTSNFPAWLSHSVTLQNNCFIFQYRPIAKCDLFLWCKAEFSASCDVM